MLCDQCKYAFSSAYHLTKGNAQTGAQPAIIPGFRTNTTKTGGIVQCCEKCGADISS